MTKGELAAAIAARCGAQAAEARGFLDAFCEIVTAELSRGGTVRLRGFGTFGTRRRRRRSVVHPATGERVRVPAHRVAAFRAGSGLAGAARRARRRR